MNIDITDNPTSLFVPFPSVFSVGALIWGKTSSSLGCSDKSYRCSSALCHLAHNAFLYSTKQFSSLLQNGWTSAWDKAQRPPEVSYLSPWSQTGWLWAGSEYNQCCGTCQARGYELLAAGSAQVKRSWMHNWRETILVLLQWQHIKEHLACYG